MDSVGVTEKVSVGKYRNIPAKIDTGADASVIWASNIKVTRDGILKFTLFGKGSPYYSGRLLRRTDFGVANIKSSNSTCQIRYRTHLTVVVAGRKIRALFYLADRSEQKFPILIGRRTIAGKFLVDVSKKNIKLQSPRKTGLNDELRSDPYNFHRKFIKGREGKK